MPMNDDVSHQDEDDKDFDRKLSDLYRAALLDEHFQQQVSKDLQTLSAEARASLNTTEQAFVDDQSLSEAARARLLDTMAKRGKAPAKDDLTQGKPSWWQKLLGGGKWGNPLLPGPVLGIPAAMMAGVLVGLLLPTLWVNLTEPTHQTRGGGSGPVEVQQTAPSPADNIPDAVRRDPQQWLNAIAELVRQGKVTEARAQLDAFDIEHPGYLPGQ